MKKIKISKKVILIVLLVIALIAGIAFGTYRILHDETKLTVEEKEWITENVNKVQNINVPNNLDIFGKNGSGVFYDFLKDLETENNITTHIITYNIGEQVGTNSFKVVYEYDTEKDVLFHKEHYVVVSKELVNMSSLTNLSGKKIGILTEDEKMISKYLSDIGNTIITNYETSTNLFEALETNTEVEYIIVPLEENLTSILTSNYNIDFHISDLNKYIIYEPTENDTFSSIVKKYFADWQTKSLNKTLNKNELKTFIDALSISDKEMDNIQSKEYNYGFIDNSPYEILMSGAYGGIVSEYLGHFSEFSNTEFTYTKYKTFSKLTEAIANNKIDIFYNYYNLDTKYHKINSLMNVSFVVVAKQENNLLINSVKSLNGKTVYVLKNSILEKYLNSLGGVDVKTYADEKDLKKVIRKDNIILMDKEVFNYYKESILNDYTIRYDNTLSETYNFYIKNNDTFNILFNKYIQTLDPAEMIVNGTYSHSKVQKSGTILGKVARYSLIVILSFKVIMVL